MQHREWVKRAAAQVHSGAAPIREAKRRAGIFTAVRQAERFPKRFWSSKRGKAMRRGKGAGKKIPPFRAIFPPAKMRPWH